ncbi:hypothetical protein [Flavobacterium sp. 25HG05S-40]|uniref:hypothetical protein n=1 Tax=Flavobacterium sp. 25HG05S-40 TaxID=3458682 RepID=UPI004043C01D
MLQSSNGSGDCIAITISVILLISYDINKPVESLVVVCVLVDENRHSWSLMKNISPFVAIDEVLHIHRYEFLI